MKIIMDIPDIKTKDIPEEIMGKLPQEIYLAVNCFLSDNYKLDWNEEHATVEIMESPEPAFVEFPGGKKLPLTPGFYIAQTDLGKKVVEVFWKYELAFIHFPGDDSDYLISELMNSGFEFISKVEL